MRQSPVFWAAFWAGLASPVSLFAPPSPYYSYLGGVSLPYIFAQVGMTLGRVSAPVADGGSVTQESGTGNVAA
jgi:hypothetical protein